MACKKTKKLKKLVEVSVSGKLFDDDLTTSVFMTFLEVLKNLKNKKFKHCFSADKST